MATPRPGSVVDATRAAARHGNVSRLRLATWKNTCSVPESITSIVASDDGFTHSPPMKKRSVLQTGADVSSSRLMVVSCFWCRPEWRAPRVAVDKYQCHVNNDLFDKPSRVRQTVRRVSARADRDVNDQGSLMTNSTLDSLPTNHAPLDEEHTSTALKVSGTIPELNGRLMRIGPNPLPDSDPLTQSWFAGPGMVHGLRLREGRADWYRNRWVRSDRVTAAFG